MVDRLVNGDLIKTKGDFFEQISLGNVSDTYSVYKFGRGKTISGKNVPIWDGNSNYIFPTTANPITLESDNVNDTLLGTGARVIRVYGLDANWNEIVEDIELNGTTPVTSVNDFLRVYRMYVLEVGTQEFPYDSTFIGNNIGEIKAIHTGTTSPIAYILEQMGQTLMAIFTIPKGYKALMWEAHTSEDRGANITGMLFMRTNGDTPVWRVKGIRDIYRNNVGVSHKITSAIPEKTDILFAMNGSASGDYVSATFELELIKI